MRYLFGKWVEGGEFTVSDAHALCDEANLRFKELRDYPEDKVFSFLGRLSASWRNPENPARKRLLAALPSVTGFSEKMIGLALEELANTLDPVLLQKKMETELKGLGRDRWSLDSSTRTRSRWQPLGTVLHVLSGNVFLVAVGSWVEGLITGNVNILKMPSEDTVFLPEFIQSVLECDPDGVISRSLAIIDYSSKQTEVIAAFKNRVDGIVVWGGESAVRAYRDGLPARTRVIIFGPKLSFGVVTHQSLLKKGMTEVARNLAFDISIWDQNACTAPQVVFVEGEVKEFAESLANALAGMETELPPGPVDLNTAVEIQKLRSVAEIAEARKEGLLLGSNGNVNWTVYVSKDKSIETSPLHRTIKLISFSKAEELEKSMEPLRGYLQTVGLSAESIEWDGWSRRILDWGGLRVLEIGQMAGGEVDDPHDGQFDLTQFGNVVYQRLSVNREGEAYLNQEDRTELVDSQLRAVLATAKKSPFYSKRLTEEVGGVSDLPKLPILSRAELEKGMTEGCKALETRPLQGGYVTRSGGSTGEPLFSIFDGEDWEALVKNGVSLFRSAGMLPGDRVANCMLAGDLYGSFVSFDHINRALGATTFAFAGSIPPDVFLRVWKEFRINVIQAMPTVLMPLFRKLKSLNPSFTIEKVMYGGVPLSPADREWLITQCGVKRVTSVIGANDGGQFAYQCEKQTGRFHHLVDEYNYVEIVDDSGKPVAQGESGRILITSLQKKNYPLIRYEIGDSGRMVGEPCTCGRTSRVIEYLGRSDDTICIAMMNLRYRDVASALEHYGFSLIQIVGKSLNGREILDVNIESTKAVSSHEVRERLLQIIPSIQKSLKENHLAELNVFLFRPGEIPRNVRTGKVKSWVDERV